MQATVAFENEKERKREGEGRENVCRNLKVETMKLETMDPFSVTTIYTTRKNAGKRRATGHALSFHIQQEKQGRNGAGAVELFQGTRASKGQLV